MIILSLENLICMNHKKLTLSLGLSVVLEAGKVRSPEYTLNHVIVNKDWKLNYNLLWNLEFLTKE